MKDPLKKYRSPSGIRCGILGCGLVFKELDVRFWHLIPGQKVPCCPDCWEALGIPPDFTDSEAYKDAYKHAESNEALSS